MSDDILRLAMEIDQFGQDYDPYGYGDAVEDPELALQQLMEDITNGKVAYLIAYHQEILEEHTPEELEPGDYERVQKIVADLKKFQPAVMKQKSVDTLMQDANQRKQEPSVKASDAKEFER